MGVTVETEYFEKLYLTNTVWEDLRFPAVGINPPGAASDPARNTTDGLLYFSKSAVNVIVVVGQMPHTWKRGSAIRPHIHVLHNDGDTGNSVWRLSYKIASPFGTFPADYTTDDITVAAPGALRYHDLFSFTEIDMSAYSGTSTMFQMLVSRLGNDAADTYDDTIALLEFDIHFQQNKLGTDNEFTDEFE